MMAAKLGKSGEGVNRLLAKVLTPWTWFYGRIERSYAASLGVVLRFPKTSIAVFSALTVAGFMFFAPRVKSDFVPLFDKGELSVKLEYPADITLERAAERTREIAAKLADVRDAAGARLILRHTVSVGKTQGILGQVGRGSHLAQVDFVIRPMTERHETISDISVLMRDRLNEEPDVLASVLVSSIVGGAAQLIQVKLMGEDLSVLDKACLAVSQDLKESGIATDVENNVRAGRPELRIRPNRAVINDMGMTPYLLGLNLRASLAGLTPATFSAGERSYDIRVRYDETDGVRQLAEQNFPGPEGRPFTLGAVAEVTRSVQQVQIVRSEKRRSTIVYANTAPGYGMGEVTEHALARAKEELPRSYTASLGGVSEYMDEAFTEFGLVTVIAITLTYLLLAAILESWAMPFVILFTIPFSYLGIFAAVVLAHQTLSIFGLLAGIMLVGVVVNAAILIIDAWRQTGDVMAAATVKFRPVLMSCAAALVGMLPMALGGGLGSELRQSMGIGSVGGIFVSTLVSLYFIPALCACIRHNRHMR
jgi:HAE1 family hydrophobic/amphiphilic exporter-1